MNLSESYKKRIQELAGINLRHPEQVPDVLYHATYRPLLRKIREEGLGGLSSKRKWEDSIKGIVYLALEPDVAESYAESSELAPESWLEKIVVLKIDTKKLDLSKLFIDRNVLDNLGDTLEYHGIIPVDAIMNLSESYKNRIQEFAKDKSLILDPEYYLDDFYSMDYNDEKSEEEALQIIQNVIDKVQNFEYPIRVYRGLDLENPEESFEGASWTRQERIARGFGNIIYTALVPNESAINLEQTIRTRIKNPGEDEIYIPNSTKLSDITPGDYPHSTEGYGYVDEGLKETSEIIPPMIPNSMNFWHGGNLDSYDDIIAQRTGRYEYGPGLYATTSYEVVKKYAKGSRKLYLLTIEKGVDISDALLPEENVKNFIGSYVVSGKRKEIWERLQKFNTDGMIKAYVFNTILINEKAIKPANTKFLRSFYVENGIDYEMVDNAFGWGEKMVVLYNMKKIINVIQVKSGDKISIYDLPTNFS